jgi:hydrogenase-4 membrane subunit HyfE
MRAEAAPRRGDAVLPNMLSLTTVAVLVGLSFRLAGHLDPGGSSSQTSVAVAVSALLLGLFTLATQTGVFTQVVGALCIENAIALLELGREGSSTPLPIELGLAAVFLLSACLYALYVRWLHPGSATEFLAERRVL